MKTLIVTADGFGRSAALSRSIIDAHADGMVTAASLVVNTTHLERAVRLARTHPKLAVGLQLNLTQGRPVSPPGTVASLVDTATGRFHGRSEDWAAADLRTEIQAQAQAYQRTGLALTHVNAGRQADQHDGVLGEMFELAHQAGVCCRTERRSELRRAHVAGVDWLIDDPHLGLPDGKTWLFQHITALRDGITELVCNPLRSPGGTARTASRAPARELRVMLSGFLARCIRYAGVRLTSFADLELPVQTPATADAGPAIPESTPRPPYNAGFDDGFDLGFDQGFDAGYEMGRGIAMQPRWDLFGDAPVAVPQLAGKRAVAVVPVRNEARMLDILLRQLKRLPLDEIVVVANGSTDASATIARDHGCSVMTFPGALGHDVARAIGVVSRSADVWLFTDADMPLEAEDLVPFLVAVASGVDVALNDIGPFLTPEGRLHVVTIAKEFLNRALGRIDLSANSLTAVPHALSARALRTVGAPRLAVPPLAHAVAITEGLRVEAVHAVDVLSHNRVHSPLSADRAPRTLEQLILGDHIEAVSYVTDRFGRRGGLTDATRRRDTISKTAEAMTDADRG